MRVPEVNWCLTKGCDNAVSYSGTQVFKNVKTPASNTDLHRRAAKYDVLAADFATVALFTPQLK